MILDYLDHLAGGGNIMPREPQARFAALRLQALCDGILDASLLIVYEGRYRPPEMKVPSWLDRQAGKVTRGLAALEAAPPPIATPPTVGQIALACVLGYRDLRFGGDWRSDHPRLRRLARQVRGAGAGFRGDQSRRVNPPRQTKAPELAPRGFAGFRQRRS